MTAPNPTLQTLVQELSASAGQPLLDNDDPSKKFTLRGAIARILWKVNQVLPLRNRPVAPTTPDDLFGQVLSLRAENLIVQAILVDLAARLGTDVNGIRATVLKGLNS